MGSVETANRTEIRIWYLLGAIALVAGLALRLNLAAVARMPGHGDSAFYYTVAKNIVDGRGLVVDYVVYFFVGLAPIPHYAGDFWNPLAEILLSLPMRLLGKSVFNALLASIAAGCVPALVAFFAARRFSDSIPFSILAGILTFFSPYEVWVSSLTEAIIFFGAFGSLALLFAIKGREKPRQFLVAALCTGLAQLVRQDGILLLFTLLVCIGFAPIRPRTKLGVAGLALAIHLLVISPVLIRNYAMFHSPFTPGPASTMFMTTYEDFHSYGKELDWTMLRAAWGIRGLITKRLHTAAENLSAIQFFMNPLVLLLASLGAANLFIRRRHPDRLHVFLPVLVFAVFEYLFYTVLVSFSGPGSLPKGLAVVMPFVCILIVDLLDSFVRPTLVLAGVVLVLAAYTGYRGYQSNYRSTVYYNRAYENYESVQSMILRDAGASGIPQSSIVIMARDVWDVAEATGFKAVMIPNNDLETILFVARHYNVQYMLLPAPRKALDDIYLGTTPDPHFKFLGSVPDTDWKIFKVRAGEP
jgi:hypothetical protein